MSKLKGDFDRFILAGNARFTIRNVESGNRFTYRVSASNDGKVYFVSVLTGSDNETDYSYLGIINNNNFRTTHKSKINPNAPSMKAFSWFWRNRKRLPKQCEVHHEGRCGRCARILTVPESIETGLGPVCAGEI